MMLSLQKKGKEKKKELAKVKHGKLILKTDQPTGYWLVD